MLDYYLPVLRGRVASMVKSEKGATAVEYGIMVAAIAAVIVATVVLLGPQLNAAFVKVNTELAKLP